MRSVGADRRRQRGMTLVEIMIVVVIMALIATGVGVAVIPQLSKSKVSTTKVRAESIRSAAVLWLSDNVKGGCPTVQNLVEGKTLDKNKDTRDAWDRDFVIECDGDDIKVISPGEDGEIGTDDDIS